VEPDERKKVLEEVHCSEIDHKETVGISNIFALLSWIIDCTEAAEKLTIEVRWILSLVN